MTEFLELKAKDCKHCYKCIRNCPVKAIRFADNQAAIVAQECVLCGRCVVSCPQNAKRVHSDLETAKALVKSGAPVVASLAPSFVANYPGAGLFGLRGALQKLGFAGAEETALGATLVKQRYDAMVREGRQSVILSTCCHTVNLLVQKYYPEALACLAPVASPMQVHCASIKRGNPAAKTVFIGPCISKKAEAEKYPASVDCALTFEELDVWLAEAGVEIEKGNEPTLEKEEGGKARLFPVAGGILRSMACENPAFNYLVADGMNRCISVLEDVVAGGLQNCFIEMSACAGSCIGGPAMGRHAGPVRSLAAVNAFAPAKDFTPEPLPESEMEKKLGFEGPARRRFGEAAVAEVLKKIGKTRPEDELNCGSCGYETCREKAQAVLAGKANLEMCLPYLMGRAQSFSEAIVHSMPGGILVLGEDLEVRQVNPAACRLLKVKNEADVLGRSVVCLMDPGLFLEVLDGGGPVVDVRQYLAEYDRFVQITVIRDEEYGLVIGLIRDVTGQETAKAARQQMAEGAMRVADEVIERQMRTVQEIASLLGETAADTQVALTQLKESLSNE